MKAVLDISPAKDRTPIVENNAQFASLFFIVAIVIITPLAIIDTPLLADYPNHVARMYVLGNINNLQLLSERYAIAVDLIPNISMDFLVPALARWLPLDLAARIFLACSVLSALASVAFLHRILFNLWSPYSLIAALVAWHGSMIAGMANFSLGIALVPAATACWIMLLERPAAWRLVAGSAMALVLFFCHLVAVGGFGLLVLGTAFARAAERQDRLRTAVFEAAIAAGIGLAPAVLFLRLTHDAGPADPVHGSVVFGNFAWKLKALLSPLANYDLALDLASFALIAALALIAWRSGRLRIDRRLAPGLALLAIAFVLAPKALWTGGVFDQRLAILLAFMLIAGTRIEGPQSALLRAAPIILGALFLLRMAVLTSAWIDHRQDLAEMRRAIDLVETGGRILVVRPDIEAGQRLAPARHRVFHHAVQLQSLPTLAVIEKSAFVSTLYALKGQQPLILKPPFDRLGGRGHADLPTLETLARALEPDGDGLPISPQIRDWRSDFDYVLLLYAYEQGLDARALELPLQPLLDGAIIDLFKIEPG